eukprot:jgi/Botrbrau1/21749/Bobra.43_1s0143.1
MSYPGGPPGLHEQFQARINQLNQDLVKIEDNIYEQETQYFSMESTNIGSVLKGFEGYLGSKEAQKASRRTGSRTFKVEDRLFSLSSSTSPATKELLYPPDDGLEGMGSLGGEAKSDMRQRGWHKSSGEWRACS